MSSITELEKEQISLSENQTEIENMEEDDKPFKCNMCQKSFSSPKKVEKHVRKKHPDENLIYEHVPDKVLNSCKTNSLKRGYDNVPIPIDSNEGLGCPFCDKKFKSDRTYKNHMSSKHPDELDEDYEPFAEIYEPLEEYDDYDVEDEEYEPDIKAIQDETIAENFHLKTSNKKFMKFCRDNSLPEPTILNGTRTCPYCQRDLVTRKGYKIHLRKRHKGELENFTAHDNDYYEENAVKETDQLTPVTNKVSVKENNSQFYDAFKNFVQGGTSRVSHEENIVKDVDRQFYCGVCKMQFLTQRGLYIHETTNANHKELVRCATVTAQKHRTENAASLTEGTATKSSGNAEIDSENIDDPAPNSDNAIIENTKNRKSAEQNYATFTFACNLCCLKFEKPRGLRVHLKRAHNISEPIKTYKPDEISPTKDSEIPRTGIINKDSDTGEESKAYPYCSPCGLLFKDAQCLLFHQKKAHKSDEVSDQEKVVSENLKDDISIIESNATATINNESTEEVITITELEVNASKFDAITKDLPYTKPKNKDNAMKGYRYKCRLCNNKYRFKHGLTTHMKKEHPKGTDNLTESDICVINYNTNKSTSEAANRIETVDINNDGNMTDDDLVIIHKDFSKDSKSSNKSAAPSTTSYTASTMIKSAAAASKISTTAVDTDASNDNDDVLWDVVDKITTTATDAGTG